MTRLRSARIDDAAAIAGMAAELGYPVDAGVMVARLANLLAQPQHRVIVAQDEQGALLGWIAVERRLALEFGERIEITGLVVGGDARRGGIGRALVNDAEQWARAQGFEAIGVRSNAARAESHPFYERLGYAHLKTQHVYRKVLHDVP